MDHPRVCGEKVCFSFRPTAFLGSPPRMRGKGSRPIFPTGRLRITPAYAGKRDVTARSAGAAQDHPRVCGEKAEWFRANRYYEGSPPRMRGKVGLPPPFLSMRRITPAYAGKRPTGIARPIRQQDHPRVCGEKPVGRGSCRLYRGSPPRMRGKGLFFISSHRFFGITPAYAGKSWLVAVPLPPVWDHPRVCGEKLGWSLSRSRRSGITPAYAGKSFKAQILITPLKDHPRVCGEKDFTPSPADFALGSPPRMRGKVRRERGPMRSRRITPAYAGKRHNGKKKAIPGQDHPRVCGEKPCPGC